MQKLLRLSKFAAEGLHDAGGRYVALVLVEGNELDGAKDYMEAAENGKLYPERKSCSKKAKTKLLAASAIPSPAESPSSSASPPL